MSKKDINAQLIAIHPAFAKAKKIFKCVLGDPMHNELPIYGAYIEENNSFILSLGEELPIEMSEVHFKYFMKAILKLGSSVYEEDHSDTLQDFLSSKDKVGEISEPTIGYGSGIGVTAAGTSGVKKHFTSSKDMEEYLEKLKNAKDRTKELEEQEEIDTEEYKAVKETLEDLQKSYEKLSPEEKQAVMEDMSKRKEELLQKTTEEFEKLLKGELEEEPKIELTYEYFKNIYDTKGKDFMREELAKLPPEERREMIKKITEAYEKNFK